MVEENRSTESANTQESAAGPDWLTASVFEDLIAADFDNYARITNFHVAPAVNTGENYMTVLVRVSIDVELKDGTEAKTSYMVKILPQSEERQAILAVWNVFPKEKFMYGELIPEFEELYSKAGREVKFAPQMLQPKNAEIPENTIIMEDLQKSGFKNIIRQNGFDMVHTQAVLEKLAQFHAASACRCEAKGPYPAMYKYCLKSMGNDFGDYRERVVAMLVRNLELFNATFLEEKLKTYAALVPDQYQAESPLDRNEFNVLNHGDCWSNNVMFQYDNEGGIKDTYFIDFQMSRYGSPAQDLQYMLLSSTCLENKFKNFDYFISYYHKKLVENLQLLNYSKPLPLLRDLHISLLRYGDWAYTIAAFLLPIVLFDPSNDATIDNLMSEDVEGVDLRMAMYSSKRYIEHMKQLLPWMDRRGLLE